MAPSLSLPNRQTHAITFHGGWGGEVPSPSPSPVKKKNKQTNKQNRLSQVITFHPSETGVGAGKYTHPRRPKGR